MNSSTKSAAKEIGKVVTLGNLMDVVATSKTIPASRKTFLRSAIKRARTLLCNGAEDVRADPQTVLRQLNRLSPAMAGLKPASLANLKSGVRAAFRLAAPHLSPARAYIRLTGAWAQVERLLDRHEAARVSRFLRFAQSNGWQPGDITEKHLRAFEAYLRDEVMLESTDLVVKQTARTWNRATEARPEWPRQHLPVPPSKKRSYWVRADDLPMSLQLEMRAYLHRLARPDPFLGGTGKALAPGTVHQYRLVFIQLASALVASGMPIGEITSLRTLVTPSNVRTALTFFHARAGERVTHQIHMLAYRAQRIARDLGGQSEEVLRELADISATIKGQAPKRFGLTEKNRRLLEHMEDPAFVDRLVMLPDRLLQAAERATGKDAASRARDAVAIEILLTCGMRVGNLVDLRIGDTIRAYGQGRDARWVIEIPAEKVKNGQPLRFTLPKESGQLIELYLKKWHPYYGGAASPWLLPSKAGGHMDPHYLSRSIATQARRHVGVAISCHQFRHLTAELYLRQDPTGIGIVSQHLGHRSINTTRNYYAREQTRVATQRYHEVLSRTRAAVPSRMRVRKESPPRPGPR